MNYVRTCVRRSHSAIPHGVGHGTWRAVSDICMQHTHTRHRRTCKTKSEEVQCVLRALRESVRRIECTDCGPEQGVHTQWQYINHDHHRHIDMDIVIFIIIMQLTESVPAPQVSVWSVVQSSVQGCTQYAAHVLQWVATPLFVAFTADISACGRNTCVQHGMCIVDIDTHVVATFAMRHGVCVLRVLRRVHCLKVMYLFLQVVYTCCGSAPRGRRRPLGKIHCTSTTARPQASRGSYSQVEAHRCRSSRGLCRCWRGC